jgi:hypothetical protein
MEELMNRYPMCAMHLTLWLVLSLLSYDWTQEGRAAGPSADARSEPVLKADDDAKTIISKAVKAHGGEKAFSRWSCGYLKYKTKGGFVPTQVGEVTVEDTFQLPGHFKRVTRMDAGGKELLTVYVINDGKGWIKKGDAPAEPIDNKFTERTDHPFAALWNLAPLTDEEVRLTKLGAAKVNGKDAIGVRAQSNKLSDADFYFSPQTGLLLKSRRSLPGADPAKPKVMETFLDDYKDVQGTPVPMQIKGVQDGKEILHVTLLEAKFAEKFEESTFAKP